MESKCCKRFATTEAEIEEKRLKLNAERTIKQKKQQKMTKILHTIIYTVTVSCVQCDILCKISELGYKSSGIRSPMAIGWLFLEHSHQHKL